MAARLPQSADYWTESARPLTSLAFVLPILGMYEAGLLWLGPQAMRNGAEVWLRAALDAAGFGQYFLPPLLTCAALLAWHHLRRDPWRIRPSVLAGMAAESAAAAALLLAVARWRWAAAWPAESAPSVAARLVSYFGAGVYEELLFRMLLLPAIAAALRRTGLAAGWSLAAALAASSLAFAAAHYRLVTPGGDPFDWGTFCFRSFAGAVFGLVFWRRGFGVAAGAHTCYDVCVALWP